MNSANNCNVASISEQRMYKLAKRDKVRPLSNLNHGEETWPTKHGLHQHARMLLYITSV